MNKQIVISGVVIIIGGSFYALSNNKPLTPVITGGYVMMLALSVFDLFGGPVSQIAGGIAMVAAIAVVLTYGGPLVSDLMKLSGSRLTTTNGASGSFGNSAKPLSPNQTPQTGGGTQFA